MKGDFLTRLQSIDRRIIYTVIFLVLLFPMLKPMGLPLKVTRETQAAFDTVDALPPRALVMFTTATAPGVEAELEPQSIAMIRHMIKKNLRIVFVPTASDSPRYCDRYSEMCVAAGYKNGVDFMQLPYQSGGETLFAAIGTDLKSAYSMLGASELWDSITGIKNFDCLIDCGGGESQMWALGHIEAPHKVKTICLITAVILAVRQPYFSSGQFKGILSGLSGAAEYEFLARVPGLGAAGMDAQSLGHLWVIVLIVVGNIAFFLGKGRKAEPAGGTTGGGG
jgi:hypothetical protein